MATNLANEQGGLYGLQAELASQPRDEQLRQAGLALETDETGRDGKAAFEEIEEQVRQQEPLALSRQAIDTHWTAHRQGLLSELRKTTNRSQYEQSFAPGALRTSIVPNKAADLCAKLTETVLVDRALPDPEPTVTGEVARLGARMAKEFLRQDGGEAGTDDVALFYWLVGAATTRSCTFAHLWIDPTGGGFMPRQVKAHPKATDPRTPLDAVDPVTGMKLPPTTDYILRYVTPDERFTDDPSAADVTWLPKIRADRLDRRHVRLLPDHVPLTEADGAIVIYFSTVREARTRWPETVGTLPDAEVEALCEWRPIRGEALVPTAMRHLLGRDSTRKGALDDRLLFHYTRYRKPCPDYPDGEALVVNGAHGGTVLHEGKLVALVERPSANVQDKVVRDRKPMDVPLVDMLLILDTEDGDPMGRPVIERVGGANAAAQRLSTGTLEALERSLSLASFLPSTSTLNANDIEASRRTGKPSTVTSKDDFPFYEPAPPIPQGSLETVDWLGEQMDSAFGLSQAAQGDDKSPEVSGVARRIAVNQSLVSVGGIQSRVHRAHERYWRLKLQLAMAHFTMPQLLRYVGTDGAAKAEWFTGSTFALCGQVRIQKGTGTLLPPTEKVSYARQLQEIGYVDADEAADIARPAAASALGVADNPHQQRIERQVGTFMEGPPEGWEATMIQYQMDLAAYQAQVAQQQALAQQQAVQQQNDAAVAAERAQGDVALKTKQMEMDLKRSELAARTTGEAEGRARETGEAEVARRSQVESEERKVKAQVRLEQIKHEQALELLERQAAIAAQPPPAAVPPPVAKVTTIERLPDGGFRAVTVPIKTPSPAPESTP